MSKQADYLKKVALHLTLLIFLLACQKDDSDNNGPTGSWTKSSTGITQGLNDLHFHNQHGIISGDFGTILITADGGTTWAKSMSSVSHSFTAAFALSEKDLFVARLGLYKSNDEGSSFSEIGNTSSFGGSIFGIHFKDSLSGLIAKSGSIYATNDGGITWVNTYNQYGYSRILNFVSDSTLFLLGGRTFDGKSNAEAHKSADYGKTWTQLSLPIELAQSQILASSFLSEAIGFVVTLNNKLFETNDGGKSWTKVADLDFSTPNKLLFINSNVAYCIAGNSIYKSTDSGKNWMLDFKASQDVILTDLDINFNNSLFVTDNQGFIYTRRSI